MKYKVKVTKRAQRDLWDIYEYIALNDSPDSAEYVFQKIEEQIKGLCELPARGVYPKELLDQGVADYREIFFKPYRIVYEIKGKAVFVYLVADGRRDFRALLNRRLLGG